MTDNERMIEALCELVSIKSVSLTNVTDEAPFGENSLKALKKALEICEELGFRTKNCSNKCGWAEIGEGEEMVGVLCHLDVVPEGNGWDTDPFDPVRKDGKIIGRGAIDDKGGATATIFAMKDILDSGVKLNRRIRVIFGTAEEKGDWDDIEFYKETEELPAFGFTPDAEYPAIHGEKGIMVVEMVMPKEKSGIEYAFAGNAVNVVPEEASVKYIDKNGILQSVKCEGKAAHGSMPELGINAVSKCMEEIVNSGAGSSFAEFYMKHIGWDVNGNNIGCGFKDEKSGVLTMNPGMIRTTEDCIILSIDVRCPIDYAGEDVINAMKEFCDPYGIEVKMTAWKAPVYTDVNGPVLKAITDAYREMTGDYESVSRTMGGGTYARAMKNIVAIGVVMPGHENREHMSNEYILEEDLILDRKIYAKALERLANIGF